MSKTIGLKQLAQKTYRHVTGISDALKNCIGLIEDSFDLIIYGPSGNGKTNGTVIILKELLKAMNCKAEYISFEEGHTATIQETLIRRHNLLEELGNVVQITDHVSYEELKSKMIKQRSAKIWIIDSLQDSRFTIGQCDELKRLFVLSKRKKIIIYVSWSDGKKPMGSVAKAVEYHAGIKLRVEGYIIFPKSRYGGNMPFVIWEGDKVRGAKAYWGDEYHRVSKGLRPKKHSSRIKEKNTEAENKKEVTSIQVLPEMDKNIFNEPIIN